MEWLKALAKHAPVLFIVEDLHWVDPATLELLSQVMEQGHNDRLLTIFTLRPAFETPWGSRAHQTQLALNRLSRRHAAAMLAAQSGTPDIADALLESVMVETGAVPLAVEEFARQLAVPVSRSR